MYEDLKHVIPLGLLQWGVYPQADHRPIKYIYQRPNGSLYLYRTTDLIEINITDVSAYDANMLIYWSEQAVEIQDIPITDLTSIPLIESKGTIKYEWPYKRSAYLYIIAPAIYNVFAIFHGSLEVTQNFALTQVYYHQGQGYYVFSTPTRWDLDTDETIQVIFARISDEDKEAMLVHVEDYNNPHRVNKDQVGLPNVDNTSDMDKPISNAQRAEFDRIEEKVDSNHLYILSRLAIIDDDLEVIHDDLTEIRETIDDLSTTLNNRITQEVLTLNNRITFEVNTINTRIDNEVATINNRIDEEVAELGANKSAVYFKQLGASANQDLETIVDLKIVRGTTTGLNRIPVTDKQVLFNTDLQEFYVDGTSGRIKYGTVGLERIVNANANSLLQAGCWLCSGTKTNFPNLTGDLDLNNTNATFVLFTQFNGTTNEWTQDIAIGTKRYTRRGVGTQLQSWELNDIGALKNLLTPTKDSLVGAINDIYGSGLFSSTINRIEIIPTGSVPPVTTDNVLYIEIPGYLDGIDFMEIIMPDIVPPFIVR